MKNKINELKSSKFWGFAIVGTINTGLSFVIYIGLLKLNFNYIIASIISYITGIIFSYLLNSKFVFKQTKSTTNFIKFVSVYISALAINLSLLYFFVSMLKYDPILAQIFVTLIVMFYNYFLQKLWTFAKNNL